MEHFDEFNRNRQMPDYARNAVRRMLICRTDQLGGHAWRCTNCKHTKVAYNSCKNRSCPQCGWVGVQEWAKKTAAKLKPVDHFHIIFSIPQELNGLWIRDTKLMIHLFFKAVRQTLESFSQKHIHGEPGCIMTLHTWSRTLALHPHIHCLFTAGGEDKKGIWHDKGDYLFNVKNLSRYFRGSYLYLIRQHAEQLGGAIEVNRLIHPLFDKNWHVYITEKYAHGNGVVRYLANYVRGGPIKNSRIVAYDGQFVTFRYKDHRDNKNKTMRLPVSEFLRRFIMHLVPKGQRVIRVLGIYAKRKKKNDALLPTLDNSIRKALLYSEPENCPYCKMPMLLKANLSREEIAMYKPPPKAVAA